MREEYDYKCTWIPWQSSSVSDDRASSKLFTHAQSCQDSSGLVDCDHFLLLRSVQTSCQQTCDHCLIWSICSQPCFGDSGSEGIITLYACLHEIIAWVCESPKFLLMLKIVKIGVVLVSCDKILLLSSVETSGQTCELEAGMYRGSWIPNLYHWSQAWFRFGEGSVGVTLYGCLHETPVAGRDWQHCLS